MPLPERSALTDLGHAAPVDGTPFLAPAELRWLSNFKSKARRQQSAWARISLKHLFLSHLDNNQQADADQAATPFLLTPRDLARFPAWLYREASLTGYQFTWCGQQQPGFFVSLAHNDHFAAASLGSSRPIGVDVETIAPRSSSFLSGYFTRAEHAWVARTPHRTDFLFTLLWCLKECALKSGAAGPVEFNALARLELIRFPEVTGAPFTRTTVQVLSPAGPADLDVEIAASSQHLFVVARRTHSQGGSTWLH